MSLCQLVAFCPCLLDRPIRLIRGFAPYRRANLSCGEIREREGQDSYAGLAGSVRSLAEGRSAARERVRRAPVANSGNILPCGLIAQAPHSQAVTPERKHQSERYPRPPNPPPYSPHSSRVRAACSDQWREGKPGMGQSRAAMVWGSVGESSCLLWLRPQLKAGAQGAVAPDSLPSYPLSRTSIRSEGQISPAERFEVRRP